MKLNEIWLNFTKKYVDMLMMVGQRDSDVSLNDWNIIQEDYKKIYGKYYERQ